MVRLLRGPAHPALGARPFKTRAPGRARAMERCLGPFIVERGQEVLWPPIVRIPEWRVRAGGVQWPVMPSKGDAGRCRGVYVAHKSDTARDASRRERNFLIGKSCESPRLKGVLFIKACSSNRLAQRWARARAEHVSCGSWGWSNGKQSFMLSQDGKVWETKDRARTKIDVRKVPGWDLPFPGWRRKRGRRSPRTAAGAGHLRSPLRIKAGLFPRFSTIIRVFLA